MVVRVSPTAQSRDTAPTMMAKRLAVTDPSGSRSTAFTVHGGLRRDDVGSTGRAVLGRLTTAHPP
ncbi:hypothetical protein GCM10010988_13340 [Cnuibacter physcomitrellae]|uniref:Uncharacterized protein n=1 Tax=Cnuibacter physcomitrellae TaxID=1619308 RepID=A0A1X9LLU2_9MICO|nr:hypothetical protein B5808_13620 [Cnuibacter physcomitrellae]GGI37316.1 hypothetical protein GCM10010988_13340 [Cnuibacter physcomitrellae]